MFFKRIFFLIPFFFLTFSVFAEGKSGIAGYRGIHRNTPAGCLREDPKNCECEVIAEDDPRTSEEKEEPSPTIRLNKMEKPDDDSECTADYTSTDFEDDYLYSEPEYEYDESFAEEEYILPQGPMNRGVVRKKPFRKKWLIPAAGTVAALSAGSIAVVSNSGGKCSDPPPQTLYFVIDFQGVEEGGNPSFVEVIYDPPNIYSGNVYNIYSPTGSDTRTTQTISDPGRGQQFEFEISSTLYRTPTSGNVVTITGYFGGNVFDTQSQTAPSTGTIFTFTVP